MKPRRALSLVLFVLTLGSLLVQAASQGPNYAGAASTVGWTDAANATGTPDSACASRSGAGGGALDLTNFGFTIPDAATINGITVEVKFAGTTAGDDGVRVRLLKGGSPTTAFQDILAISGQSDCSTSAFQTVGSPADLWGTTWNASDINAANFGVRLTKLGNTGTSYVDSVRITVEYQDVMTVTVISGGALTANVNSAATVESGKVEFLSQNQNGTTPSRLDQELARPGDRHRDELPRRRRRPHGQRRRDQRLSGQLHSRWSPRSHRREGDAHPCRGSHGQRGFASHARRLWRRQDRHVSVYCELLYRRRYLKEQL
jgi:hypothetical protein